MGPFKKKQKDNVTCTWYIFGVKVSDLWVAFALLAMVFFIAWVSYGAGNLLGRMMGE